MNASVPIVAAAAANGSNANTRRRATGVWIHSFGPVSSSPARLRQNVTSPTVPASRSATALLLGFFDSESIAGTASFALRFSDALPDAPHDPSDRGIPAVENTHAMTIPG